MAGLSGGFDGKYGSLKNVPTLPEGVSLNDYRSSENRIYSRQGEQDFEIGLTQLNYPDGMYDVFVDSSKISSSSGDMNIVEGTNGKINLIATGSTVSHGTSSTGSSSFSNKTGVEINPNNDLTSVKFELWEQVNGTKAYLMDSNGNVLNSTDISGLTTGEVVELKASMSANNTYHIMTDAEGSSYNADIGNNATTPYTSTDLDLIGASLYDGSAYTTYSDRVYFCDNITSKKAGTTGSITSTTQDKGYSATQATLTASYSLNGESIDSFELFDGADNLLASWTESEIGETKAVSTSRTDYYIKANLASSGSDTPIVDKYEMGLDN